MTSKERVQTAIAGQSPDMVPLGFYCVDYDIVERILGRPTFVRNKIEIQRALWEGRREELADGLKKDVVELYRKIDCADIILAKEAMILPPKDYEPDPPKRIDEHRWEDRAGRILQAAPDANEIQCVHDPNAGNPREYSVDDFGGPVEAAPPDPSIFEVFDHLIAELGEARYIAGPTGGITALTQLGGNVQGLMMYVEHPEVVVAANRRSVQTQNQLDEFHIRPGVAGALMEQDMAGTTRPLVSPAMWRELCYPFMKERMDHVKQFVPQIVFHSCGNNLPLIDMFIECGIDCYQSLQTTAGMEVGKLKRRFGDRLAFWGGVPVETLIAGTPEETQAAVRTAMERGAPGGGFILGPSHSIAKNTKYENFVAMLDEFVRLRDRF